MSETLASHDDSALLERDFERETALGALHAARQSLGSAVLVEASSGLGKSRLLDETSKIAAELDFQVLRATAAELEREHPWGVAASLLDDILAPELSRRLVETGDPSTTGQTEPTLLREVFAATRTAASEAPLALIIDDAHWSDDPSLRFLHYLVRRVDALPAVVLVAVNTDDLPQIGPLVTGLIALPTLKRVQLRHLGREATGELLNTFDLPVLPDELCDEVWRLSGGNPTLITAIGQELATRAAEDAQSLASPDAIDVPATVARRITTRLMTLGPTTLDVARACAVLGDDSPSTWVAELAGVDIDTTVQATAALVDAHILRRPDPIAFTYPILRKAILQEAAAGVTALQHSGAARLLQQANAPAEQLAEHLVAGVPVGEAWATSALAQAARQAIQRGEPARSVRYLRRALTSQPPDEVAHELLIDLGLAEASAGEITSLGRFEAALARVEDPVQEARALYALGHTLHRYGHHAESADVMARGQRRFSDRDAELASRFEAGRLIAAALAAGDLQHAIGEAETLRLLDKVQALRSEGVRNASERVLLAVAALLDVTHRRPAEEASRLAREALAEGDLLREEDTLGMGVPVALIALAASGRAAEAELAANDALAAAQERGDVLAIGETTAIRAFAIYLQGRIEDAMGDARAAIAATAQGWGTIVPMPQGILAQCLIERGELDEAEQILRAVEQSAPADRTLSLYGFLHWARGRLRFERSDPAAALEDYRECERLFSAGGQTPNSAACSWRCPAALAAAAAGDRQHADALLEEDLAIGRDVGLVGQIGVTLHTRGVIRGGKDGREDIEASLPLLEQATMPLELARALVSLGSALRRDGRRVDSREPLRRALELAHNCGAVVLEQRALDELHASGARPRRRVTTGAEGLTPSERRVADLLGRGLTNKQIAETLVVTKNTVEWHLRHVYAKLGVTSRDEARERLAADLD
jgi:DNA-binding CsgD family transcriptional regulator